MRRTLAWVTFIACFVPAVASAQAQKTAPLVYAKDITDTSYSYCKFAGMNGDPFQPMLGTGRIETSGSSTTVTAETAGDAPFTSVSAGDFLLITYGGVTYQRLVTARASATEITVNAAINTTGATWAWQKAACGATAADGWIGATGAWAMTFQVAVTTINATTIGYSVECRVGALAAVAVSASTIATATTAAYTIGAGTGAWDECRLGLKVNTDTGVQSVSASVSRQDLMVGMGAVAGLTGSSSSLNATVPILVTDGTAAAPSIARSGGTTTGFRFDSAGVWVVKSGVEYQLISGSGATSSIRNCVSGAAGCASAIITAYTNSGINYSSVGSANMASISGSTTKTLTDNGLVAFVKIAVPADDYAGGDVIYTLYCKDAADQVTRTGRVAFSAQAKTTTSACPATLTTYGYNAGDISNNAKTFTAVAFTCLGSATAGSNLIQLQVQADCSITTPTSMTIEYRLDMPHPQTVTPQ